MDKLSRLDSMTPVMLQPHIDEFVVEFVGMATLLRAITYYKRQRECHLSVDTSCKAHGVLDQYACSNHTDRG